jgi:4a-hydroxytetrahydrobiopterin dehydratase
MIRQPRTWIGPEPDQQMIEQSFLDSIRRTFELDDFKGSVDFVNRLTPEAEEMNHHPDLEISWNKVTVSITTHSEGGLTDNDFELAGRIARLA